MKQIIFILAASLAAITSFAQPAGNLDPSFGNAGKVVTSISNSADKAYAVAIQEDGKIVIAGHNTSGITGKDFVCIRLNEDGTPDTDFGTNGVVTTDIQTGSDDVAYAIAIQQDGKIILAGSSDNGSNQDAAMIRYNTDGSIDTDFGVNGIILTNFENTQNDEIRAIKIHPITGNIIAGGSTQISTNVSKPVVARYTSGGILDTGFNATGIKLLWVTNLDYQYLFSVEDLYVQSNGKITVCGWRDFPGLSWSSDYWFGRINSDGTMDTGFSTDGVNTYNGGFNGHDRLYSMVLTSDGTTIVAGGSYVSNLKYDVTTLEINSNGTTSGFSAGIVFGGSLDNSIAYGIREDATGRIIVAGSSGSTTVKSFAVARLSTSGALDTNFGTGGKVTTTFTQSQLSECFDIAIQTDNKIVAVGYTGNDIAVVRYLGEITPALNEFTLTTPANGAIAQNYASLAFNWTDAFGATSYEIEIATDPDFTQNLQLFSPGNSAQTVTNLIPATVYYWRVRALANVVAGDYSDVWSFTTNTLENFNLISPANNATNQPVQSLALDWSNALGASGYQIEVATDADFTQNLETLTSSTSGISLNSLTSQTQYFWHVRATANGSQNGDWSATWNFTTGQGVSVEESISMHLVIYPNPATDRLSIQVNENMIGQAYTIHNVSGRVIISGKLLSTLTLIETTNWAVGHYVIVLANGMVRGIEVVR